MHASNKPDPPTAQSFEVTGVYAAALHDLWHGSVGHTVRCVPTRRTVAVQVGERWLFGKWRRGRRADAAAEWRWLHLLPLLGIHTADPIAWIGRGDRSLLVTEGLPGRAMDAWAVAAADEGWLPEVVAYACRVVAPVVRRLHDQHLVHRDLYWSHVFAADPRGDEAPALLDVERVFRPRWRWRRWVLKDLAGLWASVPVPVSPRAGLRFLREYLGEPLGEHRGAIAAIVAKAARMRRHVPRYG
ncbi:MAG TPA: lipopolysaccharide kinase InaA family protein [Planctomycetota bacterium]|nr:lipopolysaccharide kinase InaA family protein [Planctomycetota bacterium]